MVEFKCYVDKKELEKVNISSLLFENKTICTLQVNDICASLVVNGDIKIFDNRNCNVYKNCSQYPIELIECIKKGVKSKDFDFIDNNWFELFIDRVNDKNEIVENIEFDIAEIENTLDTENILKSLFDFMVENLKSYADIDF